jgi:hypothetical protein
VLHLVDHVVAVAQVETYVAHHDHVGGQIEALDLRMRRLDRSQQPRADAPALRLRRHRQHADQAGAAGDEAADRADDPVAVHRLQHGGREDVLADDVDRFRQRRDLPHVAGPGLGLEGDLLEREDRGRVVGTGGDDREGLGTDHGACNLSSNSSVG